MQCIKACLSLYRKNLHQTIFYNSSTPTAALQNLKLAPATDSLFSLRSCLNFV